MDERPGCLTMMAAYCLGTYMLVPLAIAVFGWHSSLVFAPVVIPIFFLLAVGLIGNSELPTDVGALLFGTVLWVGFIIGAFGLVRSFSVESSRKWPFAVIISAYAAGALWLLVA